MKILVRKQVFNFLSILSFVFISVFTVVLFKDLVVPSVQALECKKWGTVCGWDNWYDPPKVCSNGDPGAQYICCFWTDSKGTNCASVGPNKCACGNVRYRCGGGGNPTPTPCSCNPIGCPPGRPANKFMTVMTGNGSGRSCGNPCSPSTYACDPISHNAAPSCSMLPANISMNRNEAPRQINLTVTDPDYGDTVVITKVQVKDTAGKLKSCVDVLTTGGGALDNATVRTGSDNPGRTSQTTTIIADSRYVKGDYDIVNGQAVCSGLIKVEIRDLDSDGGGPDISEPSTICQIGITVTDAPPQLSDVALYDRDEMAIVREPSNLIDGRGRLFVGSSITTQSKSRASICNEPLAILDPIKCPGGGEGYSSLYSRRRNPLLLEFTVTDANGASDIHQGGVWIQRNAVNKNTATTPIVASSVRNSFSAEYIGNELSQVPNANQMLCYSKTVAAPTIINVGVPVICPSSCAACAKKEGVVSVGPNALKFRFGLYFNDKENDQNQGMNDEDYGIFLSALDKVGIPFHNVVGKGANGWMKFDKVGTPCTAAACPNNSDFVLLYDPVAPTVNYVSWGLVGLTGVKTTFNLSDKATGAGIGGVTNRFMVRQETLDGEPLGERIWADKVPGGGPYNGSSDQETTNAASVTLEGEGLVSGEEIVAGLCVYDRAGNMSCGRNREPYVFLAPWIKTTYGDIFSTKGGLTPFSQTLPSDDGTTTDSTSVVSIPYSEQIFTVGTGLFMTGASAGQGTGISGGHLVAGPPAENRAIGFKNNYRTGSSTSAFNLYGYVPFLVGNEFDRLRAVANLNCELMNTTSTLNCQKAGNMASLGQANFNVISMSGGTYSTDITCSKVNVIFVESPVVISGEVKKDATIPNSGCVFVLSNGASLTIRDTPSDFRKPGVSGSPGSPYIDRFDAAIIANSGASIAIEKGARGTVTKSTDRLEIKGWLYSASTLPTFKRYLAPVDNRRFPSEWIIYDATLLDLFRPLLGIEKTVDLTCGTSTHVLCGAGN